MIVKVIIIGGSIAGLSCAKSLLERSSSLLSFDVILLERRRAPKTHGAGLALDQEAHQTLIDLGISVPFKYMNKEENRWSSPVVDAPSASSSASVVVFRDEQWNRRAFLWFDVYSGLLASLPGHVVRFGTNVVDFEVLDNCKGVKVYLENQKDPIFGDILIGADGVTSIVRSKFLPTTTLRYTGYVAWRGILDVSDNKYGELEKECRKEYPDLGNCAYFDLSNEDGHTVLYEVSNKCFNWLWYRNQPKPNFKSVTVDPDKETIDRMKKDATKTWPRAFSDLIQSTDSPFINVIYDLDPLPHYSWGIVTLVGDAAHPTTPHAVRGTVMTIKDASCLALCLAEAATSTTTGGKRWEQALRKYGEKRKPDVERNVLHARRMGMLKQGLIEPKPKWENFSNGKLLAQREELFQSNL